MNIVEQAKEFALRVHKGQRHGCLDMADHLTAVTGKLNDYWDAEINQYRTEIRGKYPHFYDDKMEKLYETQMAAAWLHDSVEDTNTTIEEILEIFGFDIGILVQALTDSPGRTRLERHLETYHRIRSHRKAILIKLCDRWHNHSRSIENKEHKYCRDYANEYLYFKFALYDGGNYLPFWKELDVQYEQLKSIVKDYTETQTTNSEK